MGGGSVKQTTQKQKGRRDGKGLWPGRPQPACLSVALVPMIVCGCAKGFTVADFLESIAESLEQENKPPQRDNEPKS